MANDSRKYLFRDRVGYQCDCGMEDFIYFDRMFNTVVCDCGRLWAANLKNGKRIASQMRGIRARTKNVRSMFFEKFIRDF